MDFATRFVAEAPSLDITGNDPSNRHGSGGGSISLREVLVGTIEEYARHMGHADLLRERIDGRIGQEPRPDPLPPTRCANAADNGFDNAWEPVQNAGSS